MGSIVNRGSDDSPIASREPVVELRGISKRFARVLANDNVSLRLQAGEIHAVLGENGAGKTTLMNILSGMYRQDSGTIRIRGQEVRIDSPAEALRQGIGTVYQHFTLVPNLSVIENVVLGMESGFRLDLGAAEGRVRELLAAFELSASPKTEVRQLSLGERQRVEIVKVLFRGSRVLLLDEPTSVLTPVEVRGLFDILPRLRDDGVAVVMITHKLDEALEVSDRVTVLRGGRNVGELGPVELSGAGREAAKHKIVELMFGGGELQAASPKLQAASGKLPALGWEPRFEGGSGTAETGTGGKGLQLSDRSLQREVLLNLNRVTAVGARGTRAVREVSLQVTAGEIFGIAGVDGNGQKELGEVIAGQRRVVTGSVKVAGAEIANRGVAAAARAGAGYVTDDRLGEGAVPGSSVADNIILKRVSRAPFSRRRFWLDRKAIDAHAAALIEQFNVKTPGTGTRMTLLSGGNIQKVLLARELAGEPRVLVCNKPTNGLDLNTAKFVLRTLRDHASRGNAVLLISSELDELLEISDRIGVMFNGELVATFSREEAELETIGHYMLAGSLPQGLQADA